GKSFAVALLTPLSVACADRTTATSSSNGEWGSSSDLGSGFSARNRSKICRRFCGFTVLSDCDYRLRRGGRERGRALLPRLPPSMVAAAHRRGRAAMPEFRGSAPALGGCGSCVPRSARLPRVRLRGSPRVARGGCRCGGQGRGGGRGRTQ